jgi:hypothetical protein
MATVAVFLALGGGAYAAAKITGRDVVNRSLTGKDIKKRSVPLNRLKGRLARGRPGVAGPQGPKGDMGPPSPVDPSRFLPSDGATTVGVGPTDWISGTFGGSLTRTAVEANRVEWTSGGAALRFLNVNPTLPIALARRPVRLLAANVCVDATDPNVTMSGVFMTQFRAPLNGAGFASQVGDQFSDLTLRNDTACRRYPLATPFVLGPNDYVSLRLRLQFAAAGSVHVGPASFELDRAP